MKLSIVTTLYQSSAYVKEFHRRSTSAAQQLVGDDYEIIMVNDGSPDHSLELAIELTEEDKHAVVVDLSRNFGHHKAIMTGLSQADGEYIFLIDSDLEEEPEWLLKFSRQMEQGECDVVYGVQEQRKGNYFERWSGCIFYWFIQFFTTLAIPDNVVTARLMSKRYVTALLRHQEREIFLAGLWYITGFVQKAQTIKKHCSSETTYNFRRKIAVLVNSVTSFSNKPLKGIFYIGIAISLVACIYVLYLVVNRIFLSEPLSGWTSVMASIWLLGGMIISFIGIIGIYISKVFAETKQRPYTIIRHIYGKQ